MNHDILSAARQKFYSALKSLVEFGNSGSFFDDVSNLDCFFSEMRNITFVIQKSLETKDNKEKYVAVRDKYLVGDTMAWFVDMRNATTKEKPFPLKKELVIEIYSPQGTFTLKNKELIVDVNQSFEHALGIIKEVFIKEFKQPELFFSAKIRFWDSDTDVDLYPKIKTGIIQMFRFMESIQDLFPCDCSECSSLQKLISEAYQLVQCKEISFVKDYSFEQELIEGDPVGLFFSIDNSEMIQFSDLRSPMDGPIFGTAKGCILNSFISFVSIHIFVYRMQHEIMPVFMIVYSDNTQKTIPFVATVKTTYYRMVQELCANTDFNEVNAIFYCGEFYEYDKESQDLRDFDKPYSERIKIPHKDMLGFTMLVKGGEELTIYFDENKIENDEYVRKEIKAAISRKAKDTWVFDWLTPIKQKLNNEKS